MLISNFSVTEMTGHYELELLIKVSIISSPKNNETEYRALGPRPTGMCGPKSGVCKRTLTVTPIDLE